MINGGCAHCAVSKSGPVKIFDDKGSQTLECLRHPKCSFSFTMGEKWMTLKTGHNTSLLYMRDEKLREKSRKRNFRSVFL